MTHNNVTTTKETRRLSTAIAMETRRFSSPQFKDYAKMKEQEIRDRLYKLIIDAERDSDEYIAYAESVLIDQPMDNHFAWFEDIVPTAIDLLDEFLREFKRGSENSRNIFASVKKRCIVDCEVEEYLRDHSWRVKENVRHNLTKAGTDPKFKEFLDRVLEGYAITDHFGWYEDIVAEVVRQVEAFSEQLSPKTSMNSTKRSGGSGFDIYAWAEQFPCSDFYDQSTGYIYKCGDYTRAKQFGLPTPGIAVVDSFTGQLIGYAQKA